MKQFGLAAGVVLAFVTLAGAQEAAPPWKAKNVQYFPGDISRETLTQRMREFSFALNVRCQYCHAGGDGVSFEGVDFASDEKQAKVKARAMLRMTREINDTLLAKIPARAEPRIDVACVTCHRGRRQPKTLQTVLFETVETEGIAAAVARYKELRGNMVSGVYNFGEWEINELARRLVEVKKPDAAIAILEMNGEYYPKSPEIDFSIAEILLAKGEKDKALARYRVTLEKAPNHQGAKGRIAQLEKQ